MFKWLNKQGVESDEGFVVQFTGRFTAEYRERGKSIEVAVEDGGGGAKPALVYSRSSFGHLPEPDKERVIRNFRAALVFQGLEPLESAI